MKNRTPIAKEVIDFLEKSGVTAVELSRESGVACPVLSQLRTGKRRDVVSRHADALRDAMRRLSAKEAPDMPEVERALLYLLLVRLLWPPRPEEADHA